MDFIKVKTKKAKKQNKPPLHSPWQTFSNSFLSVFIETYPPTHPANNVKAYPLLPPTEEKKESQQI